MGRIARTTTAANDRALFDPPLDNGRAALWEAEHILLDIADFVYAHTSLKPVSKALFLISRCLCVAKLGGRATDAAGLCEQYIQVRSSMGNVTLGDDFDFTMVVSECKPHVPRIMTAVYRVCELTRSTDSLGLVFNTLLRGKFEGGEGLGTYLTPEEVVTPMVDMLLKVVGRQAIDQLSPSGGLLYGDICGGTGRFVYAIARRLESIGLDRGRVEQSARLFDQSLMAVDLCKLNFLFEGMGPEFYQVGDSLTSPRVSELRSRFLLLATNPPFGAKKYRWSPELAAALPGGTLAGISMTGRGNAADPSELFFVRNLDLLADGGALAIVLPDGVVQSNRFRKAMVSYERARQCNLHVAALVSLPPVTFAMGGTVAKTSFAIVQKGGPLDGPAYVAVAHHVGFTKRGRARTDDPAGNDLLQIADEFGSAGPKVGRLVGCWRDHETLSSAGSMHPVATAVATASAPPGQPLSSLVKLVRKYGFGTTVGSRGWHVSVLDVDATGLIDVIAVSRNAPKSRGIECKPGDVLVSCLNPKIWRVAVVPMLPGVWSCSPEFAVLRPNDPADAWIIALAFFHPTVVTAVQAMAKGTSSSRQRVPRDRLLTVNLPTLKRSPALANYICWREEFYRNRLLDAQVYRNASDGLAFSWTGDGKLVALADSTTQLCRTFR